MAGSCGSGGSVGRVSGGASCVVVVGVAVVVGVCVVGVGSASTYTISLPHAVSVSAARVVAMMVFMGCCFLWGVLRFVCSGCMC